MSIGAISLGTGLNAGNVMVPITISGTTPNYGGVENVLLFNPAVFTFNGVDMTGVSIPAFSCIASSPASSTTGPHNGVTSGEDVGCFTTQGGGASTTGLEMTFKLLPVTPGVGCSALHLLEFWPADSDPNGSTMFDNSLSPAPITTTYGTVNHTVDANGVVDQCTPGALATATATSTSTPMPPTSTPSATGTPKTLRTVTPTFTPTGTATAPGAPTQPAGQTPAAPQPTTGTTGGPSGGAGGAGVKITLPNTGSAVGEPSPGVGLIVALAAAGFILLGTGFAWRRRLTRASWRQ